jgi:hypothetical protein
MIYVLVTQSSGGRTGHKMKDYLTAYCLHFLYGWKIMYNDTWYNPKNDDHNNHSKLFNIIDTSLSAPITADIPIVEFIDTSWSGMTTETLFKLKSLAETKEEQHGKVIIELKNATRVLPTQLYNLGYTQQYNKLTEHLRNLYYSNKNHKLQKHFSKQYYFNITVHIRKGDVYNLIKAGYDHRDISYYRNIIKSLSDIIHIPHTFHIISEKWPGYDEKDVRNLKNLDLSPLSEINIYMETCLYEYMTEYIESDILVVANGQGSFSDLAILYAKPSSKIFVCKKYRQFNYIDDINGRLVYCDQNGAFDSSSIRFQY